LEVNYCLIVIQSVAVIDFAYFVTCCLSH